MKKRQKQIKGLRSLWQKKEYEKIIRRIRRWAKQGDVWAEEIVCPSPAWKRKLKNNTDDDAWWDTREFILISMYYNNSITRARKWFL